MSQSEKIESTKTVNRRGFLVNVLISLIVTGLAVFVAEDYILAQYTARFGELTGWLAEYKPIALLALAALVAAIVLSLIFRVVDVVIRAVWIGASSVIDLIHRRQVENETAYDATAAEREKGAHAQAMRKVIVESTYAHVWYKASLWVSFTLLLVSANTTAWGFIQEMTDEHDPQILSALMIIMSYGISYGLWTAYSFMFDQMRSAETRAQRWSALSLGVIPLLAGFIISTIFSAVGMAGKTAQRNHLINAATELSVAHSLVESRLSAEGRIATALLFISSTATAQRDRETSNNAACGAGQGDMFRYYDQVVRDTQTALGIINDVETSATLGVDLAEFRGRVSDPGINFEAERSTLIGELKQLQSQVVAERDKTAEAALGLLMAQIERAEDENFYEGWGTCQQGQISKIKDDVAVIKDGLQQAIDRIDEITRQELDRVSGRYGRTFDTFKAGTVPEYVPQGKFWSLVDTWAEVPAYIALAIVLDAFSWIIGLMMLWAPLAEQGTRDRLRTNELGKPNEPTPETSTSSA